MIVVSATRHIAYDIEGWQHRLDCGCCWWDRGVPLFEGSERTKAHPIGTYIFCSTHESVRAVANTRRYVA